MNREILIKALRYALLPTVIAYLLISLISFDFISTFKLLTDSTSSNSYFVRGLIIIIEIIIISIAYRKELVKDIAINPDNYITKTTNIENNTYIESAFDTKDHLSTYKYNKINTLNPSIIIIKRSLKF